MKLYNIVRFRFKGRKQIIRTGMTLEQAQAWCSDPNTKGQGWFDGYEPA
jgi:hypothetical protein